MANDDKPQIGFQIRRISDSEPTATPPPAKTSQQPPASPVKKTVSPKAAARKAKTVPHNTLATAGRFSSATRALSFISALAGTLLTSEVICRRSPDNAWWVEVELPCETIAHLIWTAGGQPFAKQRKHWVATTLTGELPSAEQTTETIEVSDWYQIELADLLTETALRPRQPPSLTTLYVIVLPSLSRWVLRRATALGLQIGLVSAMRHPLRGEGTAAGALIIRLQVEHGTVPSALIRAIAALPYTTVAQAVGLAAERLLVDIHYRPPLAESLLGAMIPEDETWLLGGPDIGHWRLDRQGEEVDGLTLLDAPSLAFIEMPPSAQAKMPAPIPVRLIADNQPHSRIDAVLLDDTELGWMQTFLAGRPVGETAFLLLGPGKHLLVALGGLPGIVPFGAPLKHLNPGGLFLEMGMSFYPPLPEAARQSTFELKDGQVVVIVAEGAYRFDTDNLVPAWTLWVGDAPPIQPDLSSQSKKILAQFSSDLGQQKAKQTVSNKPAMKPIKEKLGMKRTNNNDVLAKAQQAELAGNFAQAAQLLETAGKTAAAAQLYERAATQ
jgi:hypothetical protein